MKKITNLLCFCLPILFFACTIQEGCEDCFPPPAPWKVNPNIIKLSEQQPDALYNNPAAVWLNDSVLYALFPLMLITVDKDFHIIQCAKVADEFSDYLSINALKNRILIINTMNGLGGGALKEYDINAGNIEVLLDETHNVLSAIYFRGNDTIIYAASAWNSDALQQCTDYYLYSRQTGESVFIYSSTYENVITRHRVAGFDIHPQRNKLLIPVRGENSTVLIVEYDMDSKQSDTLNTSFTGSHVWFRYNKTGDKILYSLCDRVSDNYNEIGILDVNTMVKKILDVNSRPFVHATINLFPNWSPNEKHIVYASYTYAQPPGGISTITRLCILKNIDE